MLPVVVFPDAEDIAAGWLRLNLPGSPHVGTQVPASRPNEFVVVRRTGGVSSGPVTDEPIVAVEAWSTSPAAAHDLAQLARAYLHAVVGEQIDNVAVYRVVDVGGPVNLPDPESDQPRYTFSVQITLRGTAL